MEKARWIDPCRICKNEVCEIVDHFVKTKQANSVNDAARILSEQLDGEISKQSLRRLYQEGKKRVAQNGQVSKPPKIFKTNPECKTVDCLDSLINEGKKFGTILCDPPWSYSNKATRSAADEEYKKYDEINAAFYGRVWRGISPKEIREIRIWLRDAGWLMYPTQSMMANLRLRGLAANPPKLNLDLNSVKDKNNLIHISFKDDETRGRKWQRKKALAEGRLNTANGKIEALGQR